LAERTIYGLAFPELDKRRAALHMLTANFCGDHQYTVRGQRVSWNDKAKPLEAEWTAEKASCIKTWRMYTDKNSYKPRRIIPLSCRRSLKPCDNEDQMIKALRTCVNDNGSITVIDECTTASPKGLITSYLTREDG
jgi:hypothetical protein